MSSFPPGPRGPVALGRWLVGFQQRPYHSLMQLQRRFGSVTGLAVGRARYVAVFGPEANDFVFRNSEMFRWREAFDVLVPIDGETALIVSDGEDHRRRRRLVQPAFHRREVDTYVASMVAGTDAVIDRWQAGQHVDIYAELRSAIRRNTVELLFGQRLAADAEFLGRELQVILDAVNRPPVTLQLSRRLATPAWRRVRTARARVDERVHAEIAARRTTRTEEHPDVLARLVDARDERGDQLTDEEVRDQVVSLIAAGYETTSAAVAWAVYALLSNAELWKRAHDELLTVLGDRPLTAGDLGRLSYLDHVVNETLRLYPPAVISARKAVRDLVFRGYRIPAGSTILYSPYVTHRLSHVWRQPTRFDPDRWDEDLPGYQKAGPAEFLPFGGGPHRCIGATFATVELKVMLIQLLRRTKLRLLTRRPRATSYIAMRPRDGIHVRVEGTPLVCPRRRA